MNRTKIAYADFSSNPLYVVDRETAKRGWYCTKVSPGCAHCYAERINDRFGTGISYTERSDRIEWRLNERELDAIIRRRKPARIFMCDMLDLFHEDVPDAFIDQVFAVMAVAPHQAFLCLTKRPERMREYILRVAADIDAVYQVAWEIRPGHVGWDTKPWPLPNVHLGVSAENQHWADWRIPILLDTPAVVRWVSIEPMLGPIALKGPGCAGCFDTGVNPALGHPCHFCFDIDWVVCGGESGPGHRPMNLDWARSLKAQCDAAGVAWFGKQRSGPHPGIPLPDELAGGELPNALQRP